ncbi:MAG: cytochrome C oxidase assembly protein [Amylibacter sp.]
MAIKTEHPLHNRRKRSNMMLGVVLGGFVALVFAITIVKMSNGESLEAYDHTTRYSIEPDAALKAEASE